MVANGHGKGIVVGTGDNTVMGQVRVWGGGGVQEERDNVCAEK